MAGFIAPSASATTCTITSSPGVDFGSYDPVTGTQADGASTVQVSCNGNATVTLAISSGPGSFGMRQLLGLGDSLNYNLYTDATRQTVWGDGTGGTQTVSLTIRGAPRTGIFTVYGRIFSGQDVGVGNYSASLVMTVNF